MLKYIAQENFSELGRFETMEQAVEAIHNVIERRGWKIYVEEADPVDDGHDIAAGPSLTIFSVNPIR